MSLTLRVPDQQVRMRVSPPALGTLNTSGYLAEVRLVQRQRNSQIVRPPQWPREAQRRAILAVLESLNSK